MGGKDLENDVLLAGEDPKSLIGRLKQLIWRIYDHFLHAGCYVILSGAERKGRVSFRWRRALSEI
jgi:hypothetical protein